MEANQIDLTMVLHKQTAKAIMVSDTGRACDAVWLPRAACGVEMAQTPGFVVITLREQLARAKGLI